MLLRADPPSLRSHSTLFVHAGSRLRDGAGSVGTAFETVATAAGHTDACGAATAAALRWGTCAELLAHAAVGLGVALDRAGVTYERVDESAVSGRLP